MGAIQAYIDDERTAAEAATLMASVGMVASLGRQAADWVATAERAAENLRADIDRLSLADDIPVEQWCQRIDVARQYLTHAATRLGHIRLVFGPDLPPSPGGVTAAECRNLEDRP